MRHAAGGAGAMVVAQGLPGVDARDPGGGMSFFWWFYMFLPIIFPFLGKTIITQPFLEALDQRFIVIQGWFMLVENVIT